MCRPLALLADEREKISKGNMCKFYCNHVFIHGLRDRKMFYIKTEINLNFIHFSRGWGTDTDNRHIFRISVPVRVIKYW